MSASLLPAEIIRAKRDGLRLAPGQIERLVAGLVDGGTSEGQAAAFAMAVFFRGLDRAERVALTLAMRDSGAVLRWDLPGPALDKHSTGGVGDAVSLPLAPVVAACGGYVPMISGRGLGHTGGTLDKMESIPGYRAQPDLDAFRRAVRVAGCAIIGQTADLAPADKRLYAIRDVTATVESIPLITASILSKKLAAGLDGLAMDVKTGSGAFMPTREGAAELARSIVGVARGAGLPTTALLTDMDGPLADAAGNALEVAYSLDYLEGGFAEAGFARFHAVTLALAGEMLALGGLAASPADGRARALAALESGAARERFGRMVAALGGPDSPRAHLPRAPAIRAVTAGSALAGAPLAYDARALGLAVVSLGGGRARPQDAVDPRVGFADLAPAGAALAASDRLGTIHAASDADADVAEAALRAACRLEPGRTPAPAPVLARILGDDGGGNNGDGDDDGA